MQVKPMVREHDDMYMDSFRYGPWYLDMVLLKWYSLVVPIAIPEPNSMNCCSATTPVHVTVIEQYKDT